MFNTAMSIMSYCKAQAVRSFEPRNKMFLIQSKSFDLICPYQVTKK